MVLGYLKPLLERGTYERLVEELKEGEELDSLMEDEENIPIVKGDLFDDEYCGGMLREKVLEEGKKQGEIETGAEAGAGISEPLVGETPSEADPETGQYQDKTPSIKPDFSNSPMEEAATKAGGMKRRIDKHINSGEDGAGSDEPASKRVLTAAIAESIASSPTLSPEQLGSAPEVIVSGAQDIPSPPKITATTQQPNASHQHNGTATAAPPHRRPNKSRFEQMKREAAANRQAFSSPLAADQLLKHGSEVTGISASSASPSLLTGALNKLASSGVITTNIGNVSNSDAPGTAEAHQKALAKKKEGELKIAVKKVQETIEAARKEDEALEAAKKAQEEQEAAAALVEAEARAEIPRTPISKRYIEFLIPEDPTQSAVISDNYYGKSESINVDDDTDSVPWGSSPGTKPYTANAAQFSLNYRQEKARRARSAKKKAVGAK